MPTAACVPGRYFFFYDSLFAPCFGCLKQHVFQADFFLRQSLRSRCLMPTAACVPGRYFFTILFAPGFWCLKQHWLSLGLRRVEKMMVLDKASTRIPIFFRNVPFTQLALSSLAEFVDIFVVKSYPRYVFEPFFLSPEANPLSWNYHFC